jgi:hypothetical protein
VVEGNCTPITINIGDYDPLGIHLKEGGIVGLTWLGTTRKDMLENLDGEVIN